MNYGIQMYSLRDITGNDLEGALAAVAEMGYQNVEFAGFFGHSAEEVRAMLDRNHLEVSGTHSGLGELTDNFAETVKYCFSKSICNSARTSSMVNTPSWNAVRMEIST